MGHKEIVPDMVSNPHFKTDITHTNLNCEIENNSFEAGIISIASYVVYLLGHPRSSPGQ